MSEHKTGTASFDKQLYQERREQGLRGQEEVSVIVKSGSRPARGKHSERRATLRQQWRAYNRQIKKASARGE